MSGQDGGDGIAVYGRVEGWVVEGLDVVLWYLNIILVCTLYNCLNLYRVIIINFTCTLCT